MRDNKYLLAYYREFYNDPALSRILDLFNVDFDYYLYVYSSYFSPSNNIEKDLQSLYGVAKAGNNFKVPLFSNAINNLYHMQTTL